MKINDKINLLLRMQLCTMVRVGQCDNCPFQSDDEEGCQVKLAKAAMAALKEGEDPAEVIARTEDVVADILIDIGVPANGQGYPMLVEAVMYLINDPESINQATQKLYTHVGEKFGASWKNADRNMRHCMERAMERCDPDTIFRYFGNSIHPDKGGPSLSEFLARIADIARRRARRVCHE